MPDFNKGDFTQQGVNGHVNATVRLNEKRLVSIDLTSNEEDEGCTISGSVTDLLNNIVYPLGETPPGIYDFLGKGTELVFQYDETVNLKDDTSFTSWTPSTTAADIASSKTVLSDWEPEQSGYVYTMLTIQHLIAEYDTDPTNLTAAVTRTAGLNLAMLRPAYKDYNDYASDTYSGLSSFANLISHNFSIYVNASGNYYWRTSISGGPATATCNFSSFGGVYSINRGAIKAQCNTSSFSTTSASHLDAEKTNWYETLRLFKTPIENSTVGKFYDLDMAEMRNDHDS